MKLTPIKITKRKQSRTLYVPDYSNSYGALPFDAKHFRFGADTTTYKRGQLTIVFNLDGYAIEGWSYWTCIFAWTEPSEDFPKGRLIVNDTGYGSYTGKHINQMDDFFYGQMQSYVVERKVYHTVYVDKVVPCRWSDSGLTVRSRATRRYYSTVERTVVHPYMQTLDQIGWGYGVAPHQLREEARTMEHHARCGMKHQEYREWERKFESERAQREAEQRAFERQRGIELGNIVEINKKEAV